MKKCTAAHFALFNYKIQHINLLEVHVLRYWTVFRTIMFSLRESKQFYSVRWDYGFSWKIMEFHFGESVGIKYKPSFPNHRVFSFFFLFFSLFFRIFYPLSRRAIEHFAFNGTWIHSSNQPMHSSREPRMAQCNYLATAAQAAPRINVYHCAAYKFTTVPRRCTAAPRRCTAAPR